MHSLNLATQTEKDDLRQPIVEGATDASTLESYTARRRETILEPDVPQRSSRFIVEELWEGVVEDVCDSYFLAQLLSQTVEDGGEAAEIKTDEVSPEDLPLLKRGAVFYWAIGYMDSERGQRTRASFLKFRRLPAISTDVGNDWVSVVRDQWLG